MLYLTGYLHVQYGAVLQAWDENDLVQAVLAKYGH